MFLIDDAIYIQVVWIKEVACVGVTAVASVPDILVQNVITRLQAVGSSIVLSLKKHKENIIFKSARKIAY